MMEYLQLISEFNRTQIIICYWLVNSNKIQIIFKHVHWVKKNMHTNKTALPALKLYSVQETIYVAIIYIFQAII